VDLNKEWIKTAIVFYDQKARQNSPQTLLLFKMAYGTLKKRINIKSGSIILDLGCGCGQITGALSSTEVTIIGIDISKNSIKQAKSFYPQSNFLCADLSNIPFKKNTFDIITAMSSLEFCFDKAHILRLAKEKLKDNGRMYIEVRNNDFIVYGLLKHFAPFYKKKVFIKDYPAKGFQDLEYDEWIGLFRGSGLNVEKTFASVRPWNFGPLETRIKNLIIMIAKYLVPLKYHYMIGFVLKKYESKS
jgi:ubiquinone/menaquinone biosynthesis C-methylase UbiE|tara:strand:- start:171 stop:905 length:735 start_codon:yes stop_codon:yes gene_type:complete